MQVAALKAGLERAEAAVAAAVEDVVGTDDEYDSYDGLDADERLMRLVRVGEKRLLHHWERVLRAQVASLYPKKNA